MTAPASPELAAQFYEEWIDSNQNEDRLLIYLIGSIATGGWVDIYTEEEFIRHMSELPSFAIWKMYLTDEVFTQDQLTAAQVACKLAF